MDESSHSPVNHQARPRETQGAGLRFRRSHVVFSAVPVITNISTYCFAELEGLKGLREELQASCKSWNLKGTILLSTEGVNLFVAGAEEMVDRLLVRLRAITGLEKLTPKVSLSDHQPFNRMLVRIKKEIISFGVEGVRPGTHTSPKLSPKELKRWLDEGRPVTLLDTRNDYEVKLGTFKGALDPKIRTFREFPEAVRQLPEELKNQPIVMFCTGGIRCEKAGPFMEMEGFKNIHQLDGGILKYFEECGGEHYDGDCFVFDQRVGVDPALRESGHAVCYACLTPLDDNDQDDPRFVQGKSCPYCHKSEPQQMAEEIEALENQLRKVCAPLPGSIAQENRRPVNIPAALDRHTLLEALVKLFPQVDAAEWEARCDAGRFMNYGGKIRGRDHVVRAGERILQIFPPEAEPDVATDIRVMHLDEAVMLIHKPAPLPMHASGRFHRNTLQHLLNLACAPHVPRPVHRLDSNTTGIVLFARTRHFCRVLQRQFLDGSVVKRYLVGVAGHPPDDQFSCDAPISADPETLGTHSVDEAEGLPSSTEFRVLERRADGNSLLEATLKSGRTNQIRIHLWHLGFPVIGDQAYLADRQLGNTQTLTTDAPPMQLHSWQLSFQHPRTREVMSFESKRPEWAR